MSSTMATVSYLLRFHGRITSVCTIRSSRSASTCSDWRFRLSPTLSGSMTAPAESLSQFPGCRPSNQVVQQRYNHYESGGSSSGKRACLPPRMTIARASRLYRASKLTSQQVCEHSHNLALFGENSLCLNAYAKLLPLDEIIEQAQKSDERIRNGVPKSDLDGIPVTIKANIAVGRFWEMPNAGSAILTHCDGEGNDDFSSNSSKGEDFTSDTNVYESDIAKRLKDCGAVIIGITNMDEFGMGSLGTNNGLRHSASQITHQKQYLPTYNPVPWMQRLFSMIGSQLEHITNCDEHDEYWLKQIQSSTPQNPHRIDDENDLADLLTEVQSWVYGNSIEQNNGLNDESPLLSPGGSSSGAAAAISHGSSLLSIGTDTGGSLRLPSAWTSTVGFKPTYGTWSRYGVVNYASSLDTVGFITGTTECAEIAWGCLRSRSSEVCADGVTSEWNGQLCRDSTAREYHKDNKSGDNGKHYELGTTHGTSLTEQSSMTTSKPLASIRIGIPSAFSLQELPPFIADAWSESARCLQNAGGATLVSISESKLSSEWMKLALASYYVLACAEASSNLSRYDGVRYGMDLDLEGHSNHADTPASSGFRPLVDMTALEQQISATRAYGFGEEVQRRVLGGTSVLSSDRFHTHYEAAAVVRANISRSLENVFRSSSNDEHDEGEKVDVMLVPTALSFPCRLNPIGGDGEMDDIDPTAAFANDVMTIPISLGGFPSVSVPVYCSAADGVECEIVGMQLFASRGSEDQVLRVANALK